MSEDSIFSVVLRLDVSVLGSHPNRHINSFINTVIIIGIYLNIMLHHDKSIYKSSYLARLTGVGMSNGRNANHVTLPAVCQPFSIAATCGHFRSSTFARSAIRLAICFRLPLLVAAVHRCLMIAASKHE